MDGNEETVGFCVSASYDCISRGSDGKRIEMCEMYAGEGIEVFSGS